MVNASLVLMCWAEKMHNNVQKNTHHSQTDAKQFPE